MVELLAYLRANGFKTFIVSGGGVEFMRPWTEKVYGVPPEQVVGSSIKTEFKMQDDTPTLFRLPEVNFIDDKAGKPVGINQEIGRRPIAAFGNSDGDLGNAPVDDHGRRARASRHARSSHRCGARIRLRPQYRVRPSRQGARCSRHHRLDGHRHESRLEDRSSRTRTMRLHELGATKARDINGSSGDGHPACPIWEDITMKIDRTSPRWSSPEVSR